MGKVVNKRELSEILGTSEQTLTEWQKVGMPMLADPGRGHSNSYDTEAVINWRIERALAGVKNETAKERLDRITADLRELELGRRRGELVELAEIVPAWGSLLSAVRGRLLDLPAGVDIPEALRPILAERIHQALQELSQHDPRVLTTTV